MARVKNRFSELLAIKERRENRRISRRMVCEETGLAKKTVDYYARNQVTRYDEHIIRALCEYLDCTIADLLVIEPDATDESSSPKALELIPA